MLTPNLPAKDKMVDGLIIQGEPDEKKKQNKQACNHESWHNYWHYQANFFFPLILLLFEYSSLPFPPTPA